MRFQQILDLARHHADNGAEMQTSADLCITEALEAWHEGKWNTAKQWALKSLSHSVGVLHSDYIEASK